MGPPGTLAEQQSDDTASVTWIEGRRRPSEGNVARTLGGERALHPLAERTELVTALLHERQRVHRDGDRRGRDADRDGGEQTREAVVHRAPAGMAERMRTGTGAPSNVPRGVSKCQPRPSTSRSSSGVTS